MTKEEFCKQLKESQERGILSVCVIAQKYINSLEAENKGLQVENERQKRKLKQTEVQDQVVIDELRKDNELLKAEVNRLEATEELLADEQVKILDERDNLRKEIAKLKCLALHLFKVVGYNESKNWGRIRDGFDQESKLKQRCSRNSDRWRRIANKCHEAYIKAKAELKEK